MKNQAQENINQEYFNKHIGSNANNYNLVNPVVQTVNTSSLLNSKNTKNNLKNLALLRKTSLSSRLVNGNTYSDIPEPLKIDDNDIFEIKNAVKFKKIDITVDNLNHNNHKNEMPMVGNNRVASVGIPRNTSRDRANVFSKSLRKRTKDDKIVNTTDTNITMVKSNIEGNEKKFSASLKNKTLNTNNYNNNKFQEKGQIHLPISKAKKDLPAIKNNKSEKENIIGKDKPSVESLFYGSNKNILSSLTNLLNMTVTYQMLDGGTGLGVSSAGAGQVNNSYIPKGNLYDPSYFSNNFKKPDFSNKKQKSPIYIKGLDISTPIKEYAMMDEDNSLYRDYMEDYMNVNINFMNDKTKILFGLYDGHGGADVARISKDKLPEILSNSLSHSNNIEVALYNSFHKMDDQLKKYVDMGATASLVYIFTEQEKRYAYCANVGDSRVVLIRSNKVERISYDHKGTDYKEVERIKLNGGIVFAGRVLGQLAISRALGDFALKHSGVISIPYISKHILEETDKYIIMASDGVWDVIDDEFMFKIASFINNPEELVKTIISNAITLGSMDNISVIAIKLNDF